jgi:hypothetical protein
MLECLPKCVLELVEKVNPGKAHECPEGPWRNLFYHLGQFSTDVDLLRRGAQDVILQLLVTLKYSNRRDLEISTEWTAVLKRHAPTLHNILYELRGDPNGTNPSKGYELGKQEGRPRRGTGYRASNSVVRNLAPLLHHLLRLSYGEADPDAGELAVALMERALEVGEGKIWAGQSGTLEIEEALRLVQGVREVMAAPCRGLDEGVHCTDPASYVANQRRLSSSWAFHTIYRHLPQFLDYDNEDGSAKGGERLAKCDGDVEPTVSCSQSNHTLSHSSSAACF